MDHIMFAQALDTPSENLVVSWPSTFSSFAVHGQPVHETYCLAALHHWYKCI